MNEVVMGKVEMEKRPKSMMTNALWKDVWEATVYVDCPYPDQLKMGMGILKVKSYDSTDQAAELVLNGLIELGYRGMVKLHGVFADTDAEAHVPCTDTWDLQHGTRMRTKRQYQ